MDKETKNNKIPLWMQRLHEKLERDYAAQICLDDLAEEFHINKYQICRDFKRYYGTSPLQYLNSVRVLHAKELLDETYERVGEIAYRCGFENVNTFIQLFKRQTGITPTAYRKQDKSLL